MPRYDMKADAKKAIQVTLSALLVAVIVIGIYIVSGIIKSPL